VINGNNNETFTNSVNGASNVDQLARRCRYVFDVNQLNDREWEQCNLKQITGMTREEFQSNDAQMGKLNDAASTLAALDVFPFFRFLNNRDGQMTVPKTGRYLIRKKRVTIVKAALTCALKVIKANPQYTAVLLDGGVFVDHAEFKQSQVDLAQLLGSCDKLEGDAGLEERATRLIVACFGLVLASIDRSIASLPPAPLEPAANANKPRTIKNLKEENDRLKRKLQKRTKEVKVLQKELEKLKELYHAKSDSEDDSGGDHSDDDDDDNDNDPAPKRPRPGQSTETVESDGEL
jgi:hypothetical protein